MMPKGHVVRSASRLDKLNKLAYVFDGIQVLGPYVNKKSGRRFVTFGRGGSKYGTIMLYARFVWMNHYNCVIPADYDVDHKDNDKTNDNIDNLQLLTKDANRMKHHRTRKGIYVLLRCPYCEDVFVALKAVSYLRRDSTSKYSCCTVSCATSIKNRYPKGSIDGFEGNFIREFTAHNTAEALATLQTFKKEHKNGTR